MLLQTTSEGGAQAKEYLAKYSADRVRNTGSVFLGVTMGCVECHNHKYDPFTMQDFYSMAAFFADIQERGVGNPPAYPVMGDEARQRIARVDGQLAELRRQAGTTTPEVAAAQREWETSVAAQVEAAAKFDPWHVIGPFKAADFAQAHDTAFPPEQEIDLAKSYDGLTWQKTDKYLDGRVHNLTGDNSATYLHRVVKADKAAKLELSLGSDDSIKVWLNTKLVHDNKVQRGVEPDQDKITVELQPGENQLLIKVANGSGGYGFYFRAQQVDLPQNIVTILKTPADGRSEAQANELAAYYRSIAPALQPVRDRLAQLEQEKKQIQDSLPKTLMTVSVTPRTIRLLARGNWMDDSGPVMEPAIPEFMGELDVGDRRATRLDLARWIVRPDNPLTARTLVNRLWKLFFGHGLAQPLDDLGAQGTPPTHPELLDWLAVEFVESGWDVKDMVKLMVLSGTYRQDSRATEQLRTVDPYNRYYARQSRFRLDAELVRDNALAVSGLLVPEIGGRSVKPYQPAGYWQHLNFPKRSWQQDSGDHLYRRGLYTWWQRMFLHPSLLAFDAPSREECTVERPRSNTPQQALVLLNDPTYVEAARTFAERMIQEGGADVAERLNWAYRQTLSRTAKPQEMEVLKGIYEKHLAEYRQDAEAAKQLVSIGNRPLPGEADLGELAAWTSVARVILNLHETITRS
jgi:hypothetical protein